MASQTTSPGMTQSGPTNARNTDNGTLVSVLDTEAQGSHQQNGSCKCAPPQQAGSGLTMHTAQKSFSTTTQEASDRVTLAPYKYVVGIARTKQMRRKKSPLGSRSRPIVVDDSDGGDPDGNATSASEDEEDEE